MNEIVLWRLKDLNSNEEMDIKTPFIEREIQIPQTVKIPLYSDGQIISDEELAKLGLERIGYTQEQLDEIHYSELYTANPDLAVRVRQYKSYLDGLGVGYSASMDDIMAAITISNIEDKAGFASQLKATYDAIITNLEFCGSPTPHMDAYNELEKLIMYLPEA